jgi:hypothetical protein
MRTQLERPVPTENTVGTLPESGRNPLPGDHEQTASAAGV